MPERPEYIRGVHEGGKGGDPTKSPSRSQFKVIEGGVAYGKDAVGQVAEQANNPIPTENREESIIVKSSVSPEERWAELQRSTVEKDKGLLAKLLSFVRKTDIDSQYTGIESRPPRPDLIAEKDKDVAYINYKATLFAYRTLAQLERERKSGKYPNGEDAPFGDDDEVLVSWVEGEFEGELSEYNGVLKRKDLAKILKLGLSMPFEERHKLGIPVADSGPRCIFYPFLHTFDYMTPEFFGGSIQDPPEGVINEDEGDESPFIRKYKTIKKGGRVVRSEAVSSYFASPYLVLAVETILRGDKFLSKSDEQYYQDLLKPWNKDETRETDANAPLPLAA
jgi:hypothetical protein